MICCRCKIDKDLSEFNRDRTKKTGYRSACRICTGHWATKKDRPLASKEKVKAWNKLYYALKVGKLIKPTICDICNSETTIEAHHKDYNKPLEVTWCCRFCHVDLDNERRQT